MPTAGCRTNYKRFARISEGFAKIPNRIARSMLSLRQNFNDMNIEELRDYCLSVKGAWESFPFDDTVLVFKIIDKMFAYIALEPRDGCLRVEMKCDPARTLELRERYEGIGPGHFSNSILWNAVALESDVPDELIKELIDHSVEEVVNKFTRAKRKEYLEG